MEIGLTKINEINYGVGYRKRFLFMELYFAFFYRILCRLANSCLKLPVKWSIVSQL